SQLTRRTKIKQAPQRTRITHHQPCLHALAPLAAALAPVTAAPAQAAATKMYHGVVFVDL
ncbi:hypothetical protein NPN19_24915, partial [Vibrio parahaemolyticus]|uniref:hypothetical protein n=1 Tax=Vibrio parahaemolyticus TaxID=670 RepID=UPI002111AF56